MVWKWNESQVTATAAPKLRAGLPHRLAHHRTERARAVAQLGGDLAHGHAAAASDTALARTRLLAPLGEGAAQLGAEQPRHRAQAGARVLRPGLQRGVARGSASTASHNWRRRLSEAGPRPASRSCAGQLVAQQGAQVAFAQQRGCVGRWAVVRVVGISRTTARSRSDTSSTRHWRHAACPCGAVRSPRPLGRSARAAGESTACAFRRLPPSSRRAPCPAVSTARAMAARCGAPVHRQLDHAGGGDCHLCPRVAVRHHLRVGPQLAQPGAHRPLGRGHKQVRRQSSPLYATGCRRAAWRWCAGAWRGALEVVAGFGMFAIVIDRLSSNCRARRA